MRKYRNVVRSKFLSFLQGPTSQHFRWRNDHTTIPQESIYICQTLLQPGLSTNVWRCFWQQGCVGGCLRWHLGLVRSEQISTPYPQIKTKLYRSATTGRSKKPFFASARVITAPLLAFGLLSFQELWVLTWSRVSVIILHMKRTHSKVILVSLIATESSHQSYAMNEVEDGGVTVTS